MYALRYSSYSDLLVNKSLLMVVNTSLISDYLPEVYILDVDPVLQVLRYNSHGDSTG